MSLTDTVSLPAKRSRDQHCASDGSAEDTAAAQHSPSKRPFLGTVAPAQLPPSPPTAGLDAELLHLAHVAAADARVNQQQQQQLDRTTAGSSHFAGRHLVDSTADDATPEEEDYDFQAAAYADMLAAASDTANPDQYQYQYQYQAELQAAHYAAATATTAAAAAGAPAQHYSLLPGQQNPAAAAQQYAAAAGQQYPGAAITVGQACELPSLHLKVALRTWAKLRFPSTYRDGGDDILVSDLLPDSSCYLEYLRQAVEQGLKPITARKYAQELRLFLKQQRHVLETSTEHYTQMLEELDTTVAAFRRAEKERKRLMGQRAAATPAPGPLSSTGVNMGVLGNSSLKQRRSGVAKRGAATSAAGMSAAKAAAQGSVAQGIADAASAFMRGGNLPQVDAATLAALPHAVPRAAAAGARQHQQAPVSTAQQLPAMMQSAQQQQQQQQQAAWGMASAPLAAEQLSTPFSRQQQLGSGSHASDMLQQQQMEPVSWQTAAQRQQSNPSGSSGGNTNDAARPRSSSAPSAGQQLRQLHKEYVMPLARPPSASAQQQPAAEAAGSQQEAQQQHSRHHAAASLGNQHAMEAAQQAPLFGDAASAAAVAAVLAGAPAGTAVSSPRKAAASAALSPHTAKRVVAAQAAAKAAAGAAAAQAAEAAAARAAAEAAAAEAAAAQAEAEAEAEAAAQQQELELSRMAHSAVSEAVSSSFTAAGIFFKLLGKTPPHPISPASDAVATALPADHPASNTLQAAAAAAAAAAMLGMQAINSLGSSSGGGSWLPGSLGTLADAAAAVSGEQSAVMTTGVEDLQMLVAGARDRRGAAAASAALSLAALGSAALNAAAGGGGIGAGGAVTADPQGAVTADPQAGQPSRSGTAVPQAVGSEQLLSRQRQQQPQQQQRQKQQQQQRPAPPPRVITVVTKEGGKQAKAEPTRPSVSGQDQQRQNRDPRQKPQQQQLHRDDNKPDAAGRSSRADAPAAAAAPAAATALADESETPTVRNLRALVKAATESGLLPSNAAEMSLPELTAAVAAASQRAAAASTPPPEAAAAACSAPAAPAAAEGSGWQGGSAAAAGRSTGTASAPVLAPPAALRIKAPSSSPRPQGVVLAPGPAADGVKNEDSSNSSQQAVPVSPAGGYGDMQGAAARYELLLAASAALRFRQQQGVGDGGARAAP